MNTKKTPAKKPVKTHIVVLQTWSEYERGWGQRPDGQTIHLTLEDCKKYVAGYNAKFNNKSVVPDEYTAADPSTSLVDIGPKLYEKLQKRLKDTTVEECFRYGMPVEQKDIAASVKAT